MSLTKNNDKSSLLSLFSGYHLIIFNFTKFHETTFNSFKVDTIINLKITKGCNSVKYVSQVMVLYLCTSSDHALYLYQVLGKYLRVFQSY